MFDSLRSSIRWWMFKPERLLERMADKELRPHKCCICGKWDMVKGYEGFDALCEDCFDEMMSSNDHAYGYNVKDRMYIAWMLLRTGHDSAPWKTIRKAGWKRLPKNFRYYIAPLLRTVISLIVDHRYVPAPSESTDLIGEVSFRDQSGGWWLISSPEGKWGYDLDHDYTEMFY